MYVCLCHGINERDVAQAACNGACKAADVFRQHGVRPKCGRCVSAMRQMVGEDEAGLCPNMTAQSWHQAQNAEIVAG